MTIGWLTSRPHVLKAPRLLQCVFQCLSGLLNEGHGFQILKINKQLNDRFQAKRWK